MAIYQVDSEDANFLFLEKTESPTHISLIYLYDQSALGDKPVRFTQIRQHMANRNNSAPVFRQKVRPTPGMTVVCGDSHTSTHGAFACLAHGIGTSEVEHVLATQCLLQKKSKTMLIAVDGKLGKGVTAKDVALAIIGTIGTAGGTGYAIEFGEKGRPRK